MPNPAPSEPSHRALVIVAEDDRDLREVVACSLRFDGFEVVEAADGAALAAHVLADGRPRPIVAVSDIFMPRMTGLEVLETVRARGLPIAFILMTAGGDDAVVAQARASGAQAVFEKPVDLADLSRAVRRALAAEPGQSRS